MYDTIYACQDRDYDLEANVKSTAVLFGRHVRAVLAAFSVAFIVMISLAGILNRNGPYYFVVSCAGAACHLIWQLVTWDDTNAADCASKFKVSVHGIRAQLCKR